MENSKLFQLNAKDFSKGLVLTILVVVIGAIQQGLQSYGFDFASYNWGQILEIAVTAGVGYLVKNLISEDNKIFGKIG